MRLLRKVHTYAGLLTFINLVIYGVVGLAVTAIRQPANSPRQSFCSLTVSILIFVMPRSSASFVSMLFIM